MHLLFRIHWFLTCPTLVDAQKNEEPHFLEKKSFLEAGLAFTMSRTVLQSTGSETTPTAAAKSTAVFKRARVEKSLLSHLCGALLPALFPPVSREELKTLAQPALNAVGECLGVAEVPATMEAIQAAQDGGGWFPFVRAWSVDLLESDERLSTEAQRLSALDSDDCAALMSWRDSVLEFAAMLRPSLVATQRISALTPLQMDDTVDYHFLLLELDRGELRCRNSVVEKLSGAAGDVFSAVLLSQHSEEAVAALEEKLIAPLTHL